MPYLRAQPMLWERASQEPVSEGMVKGVDGRFEEVSRGNVDSRVRQGFLPRAGEDRTHVHDTLGSSGSPGSVEIAQNPSGILTQLIPAAAISMKSISVCVWANQAGQRSIRG